MFTVSFRAVEVLVLKLVLPEYFAVIECEPAVRAEVDKVAWPVISSVAAPRLAVPSWNETFPLGVPTVLPTVAVKVTETPALTGFAEAETVVVVAAGTTDCASTADVLVEKVAVPAY